jgi:hypothetical protein
MNKRLFAASAAFLVSIAAINVLLGLATADERSGAKMLRVASSLLDSLSDEQKKAALFEVGSDERINWHFIPRERKGVPLKDLKEEQRTKVLGLLQAGLSEAGEKKAEAIMALEPILAEIEGPKRAFPRDPLLYYVSFFGKPAGDAKWGWRVEGHHLSVNFALDGAEVLGFTPFFRGANPALVREGPKKGLRVLAEPEDIARELVSSLDEAQLKAAKGEEIPNEVPGPGTKSYPGPFPAGISADKLTDAQRATLKKLILEYAGNIAEESAAKVTKDSKGGPQDIHFAWRGGLKAGEGHSYLVSTPTFVINYVNFQNDAYHVHACLRMLEGEFGLASK